MNNLLSDFDFDLPNNLIADFPVSPRDSSKLLLFKNLEISDHVFSDLIEMLPEKTVLIFNDTKVVKSRIKFQVEGKKAELFFAATMGNNCFEVLCKPASIFKVGAEVCLPGNIVISVLNVTADGTKVIKVVSEDFNYYEYLDQFGEVPLPPYIDLKGHTANEFESLYQTVYSKSLGSVAAPTAGLHFTQELLGRLRNANVAMEFITLQVGLGTFLPVRVDNLDDHKMHSENFYIADEVAARINEYKLSGYTVISVGTTTLRAIQSVYEKFDTIKSGYYETDIFIRPGYKNWYIDALLTNFHLPKSTLFILVSALIGIENAKAVYYYAIKNMYRFYSFGDASLLWLPNTK